jgi:hypothetical protein
MSITRPIGIPAALALTAAALAFAPIAYASPEDSFMDELRTINAQPPNMGYREIVSAGYQTCSELRSGTSVLEEMSAVEKTYHFNQGTLFVSAATTNLCPDFAG